MFPKKVLDNRKKNTKRRITPEVVEEVQARDWYCIFTWLWEWFCKWSGHIEEIHHAYFWADSNYWPDRNDPEQLVWVFVWCHDHIHSRGWSDYRKHCINYLNP